MITALDIIDRLPWEFAARLQADEFFCDIPVVVAEKGNVKLEMERKEAVMTAKNKKRGVAVIIPQLVGDDLSPSLQFGPLELHPSFQVVEEVELNRDERGTKKSARKVARRIIDVMKGCGFVGLITSLKTSKPCIVPITNAVDVAANTLVYQVDFECLEFFQSCPTQVQMPRFTAIAGPPAQVSIISATENAVIYYTLDDSYPSPNNEKAQVYAEPVNIPPQGFILRACAYPAPGGPPQGVIASWVARETVTIE